MHLLITGGAGFIGSRLSERLLKNGHTVTSLDLRESRIEDVHSITQDLTKPLAPELFADVDGIIHLAGRSIFGKWFKAYKQSLWDSRIVSAKMIYEAIASLETKPQFFYSASAIGYYGDRADELLNESSPKGTGFLSDLVQAWEAATKQFEQLGLRTASFRHGQVLGKGGLVGTLLPFYKLGLGGPIGKGTYFLSWISMSDLLNLYMEAIETKSLSGIYNAVSKTPIRYKNFSQELARAVNRPHLFRIPKFVLSLKYSKEFVGEITSSQNVISEKAFVQKAVQENDLAQVLKQIV